VGESPSRPNGSGTRPSPPPAAPAASSSTWRKNAIASAITGHTSEIVLQTLSVRADQFGFQPTVVARLREAAQAMRPAWAAWRAISHEWDILSTGVRRNPRVSPVTAEFSDLLLRIGRLAYQNPQWTPAAAAAGHQRHTETLAITINDVITVLSAVHEAADATTRVGVEELEGVRTAAADKRLYLPTRLMPDDCDIPHRYTPAPRAISCGILAAYDRAIDRSMSATHALDELAVTLDAPSQLLSALRASSRHVPSPWTEKDVVPRQRTTPRTTSRDARTRLRA
jgi:hypothetical protein